MIHAGQARSTPASTGGLPPKSPSGMVWPTSSGADHLVCHRRLSTGDPVTRSSACTLIERRLVGNRGEHAVLVLSVEGSGLRGFRHDARRPGRARHRRQLLTPVIDTGTVMINVAQW